jgi:hypothetical protein
MAIGGVTPAMGGLAGAIVAFLVAYTLRRIFGSDDPTRSAVLSPTKR